MGAVEHLKALCCLGLKPESAMIAVVPVPHEIMPHCWSRVWLCEPDASMGSTYSENPQGITRSAPAFPPQSNLPSPSCSCFRMTSRPHVTSRLAPDIGRVE